MKFSVKKLVALGGALTASALLVSSAVPAGALPTPGTSASVTAISPNLNGKPSDPSLLDGFPCEGGGDAALDAITEFAAGRNVSYLCSGTINTSGVPVVGNLATFSGAGTWGSFTGTGTISGIYTYSEPCQTTPAGKESGTGEASGTLTLTLSGTGVFGVQPITSAVISLNFWWSRVGLSAVVGIKGATITTAKGTANDPEATGLSAAVFIPTKSPNCNAVGHPAPADINIFSGALTIG